MSETLVCTVFCRPELIHKQDILPDILLVTLTKKYDISFFLERKSVVK